MFVHVRRSLYHSLSIIYQHGYGSKLAGSCWFKHSSWPTDLLSGNSHLSCVCVGVCPLVPNWDCHASIARSWGRGRSLGRAQCDGCPPWQCHSVCKPQYGMLPNHLMWDIMGIYNLSSTILGYVDIYVESGYNQQHGSKKIR
jgi:hypothetical protein